MILQVFAGFTSFYFLIAAFILFYFACMDSFTATCTSRVIADFVAYCVHFWVLQF